MPSPATLSVGPPAGAGPETAIEYARLPAQPSESTAPIVKLNRPPCKRLPLMRPVAGFSARPVGSVPLTIEYV